MLRRAAGVPVVEGGLPRDIFGQDCLTRPHAVQLRIIDARRCDAAFAEGFCGLEDPAPHTDDRGVGGTEVLLGAIHDWAHAGDDGVILRAHTGDAREALRLFDLPVHQEVVLLARLWPPIREIPAGLVWLHWPDTADQGTRVVELLLLGFAK